MPSKTTSKSTQSKKGRNRQEELIKRISMKAYEFFEERGRASGNDWDDWLRAEELIMRDSSAPPQRA